MGDWGAKNSQNRQIVNPNEMSRQQGRFLLHICLFFPYIRLLRPAPLALLLPADSPPPCLSPLDRDPEGFLFR